MKAVIMAGGEGTRLRPLTSMRPKPMVPIVNQPVMEHILGLVKHYGMTEIVATLQFMPQVIEEYFRDGEEWGVDISYALEETPLGTAGSVKNAEEALDDTFLVISGDALTDINLRQVIDYHATHDGPVTICLKRVDDPLEFGVVITREDGRIERFLEKPTWGQVFSDTINTGIYVIDREVLDHIPSKKQYDFSAELFPKLMDEGYPLYGYVADGYWCDVGSLGSYMQVHRDILDGKAMIYVPGIRARNDIWVGEDADIDESVLIAEKVVIGHNTKVKPGARLGSYTVIGDNCVIGNDAEVMRSVVWNDAFIGKQSAVRGAVVCRRADIRSRATVEIGAVVGDESMVGQGAVISNDVQIYPFKRIEPAATVTSSIIWESRGVRSLFSADGVRGLVSVDITPQLALRLAMAHGTTLPAGSHVVVSRDGSRAARMIKRAMVAGLNAAGVNVRDLRVASPAVTRFTARDTRSVGGVHIRTSAEDFQHVEIHFYDKAGMDLPAGSEKKVERLYFREEFRRSFFDEVGEIIYPPRALEYYTAGLVEALGGKLSTGKRMKVVADMGYGMASLVLPQVAAGWDMDLVSLNPFLDAERTYTTSEEKETSGEQLQRTIDVFQADLGVTIDVSAERVSLVSPAWGRLDGDTALHAVVDLWCRYDESDRAVAVSLSASDVVDRIAEEHGRRVIRCGRSRRALSACAQQEGVGLAGSQNGGFVFRDFLAGYDAVMTLGMVLKMLATDGRTLDEVVASLPPSHVVSHPVFCAYDQKGAVMRAVSEAVAGKRTELTEGIKVYEDGGWALVLPHADEPQVLLYAEGASEEEAEKLVRRYAGIVADVVRQGEP